jgi:hypothetical protein
MDWISSTVKEEILENVIKALSSNDTVNDMPSFEVAIVAYISTNSVLETLGFSQDFDFV